MKKILVLLAVSILLNGCSTNNKTLSPTPDTNVDGDGGMQIPNPIITLSDSKEFLDYGFIEIKEVEGATNVTYSIVGEVIGELKFTKDNVDYTVRISKEYNEEISGIYADFTETDDFLLSEYYEDKGLIFDLYYDIGFKVNEFTIDDQTQLLIHAVCSNSDAEQYYNVVISEKVDRDTYVSIIAELNDYTFNLLLNESE